MLILIVSCCTASVLSPAISCRAERERDNTFRLVNVDVDVVAPNGRDIHAVGGSRYLADLLLSGVWYCRGQDKGGAIMSKLATRWLPNPARPASIVLHLAPDGGYGLIVGLGVRSPLSAEANCCPSARSWPSSSVTGRVCFSRSFGAPWAAMTPIK